MAHRIEKLYIHTVLFDVILLRQDGRRLPRSEWPMPLRGTFRVVEMDRETTNAKRNLVKVELWAVINETRRRGLASLLDPVLLPYQGSGMLVAGTELRAENGGRVVYEHRQVWLCTLAGGTEAEWESDRRKANA